MWCEAVKYGGDSGAVRQVSDIGGGFGRVSSTAGVTPLSWNAVKREKLAPPKPRTGAARAPAAGRWLLLQSAIGKWARPGMPARPISMRIFAVRDRDSPGIIGYGGDSCPPARPPPIRIASPKAPRPPGHDESRHRGETVWPFAPYLRSGLGRGVAASLPHWQTRTHCPHPPTPPQPKSDISDVGQFKMPN